MKKENPKQPIRALVVRMDEETFQALRNHSFKNNISLAQTVRKSLQIYLSSNLL